jgi:hypothetical protein
MSNMFCFQCEQTAGGKAVPKWEYAGNSLRLQTSRMN